MGVDMKVKAIYDSEIGNITRSEKSWKDVLKVAGQLYRYEFDKICKAWCERLRYFPVKGAESTHEVYL